MVNSFKLKNVFFAVGFFVSAFVLGGCTFENLNGYGLVENTNRPKKQWTIMVYMAADNNLESAAVEDFNEMEASKYDQDKMNVIVLFDRNNLKDCSDQDEWEGARLYEICRDENGMNNSICSKRISCPEIGVYDKRQSVLDMGNPKTLKGFVSSSVRNYPAEHYGLFIWGHGTGYRNMSIEENNRAVALDDSSDSFMENCVLASAVADGMKNKKMDILVYDTCFAGELEVAYEYPDVADFFCGNQGVQTESGLDYQKIFSTGIEDSLDGLAYAKKIEENLSGDMKKDFSIIDLSEIKNVFSAFDSFASCAASNIFSESDADSIRNLILSDSECYKSFESANNPVYVNIISLANVLSKKYPSISVYEEHLRKSIERAVCVDASDKNLPLGIYFCSVDQSNSLIKNFSPYYFHGKNLKNQCSFVKESTGYALTDTKQGSFMDRIFGNYSF